MCAEDRRDKAHQHEYFEKMGFMDASFDTTEYENDPVSEDPFSSTPHYAHSNGGPLNSLSNESSGSDSTIARFDQEDLATLFRDQGYGCTAKLVGANLQPRMPQAENEDDGGGGGGVSKEESSDEEEDPFSKEALALLTYTDLDFLGGNYWTLVSGKHKDAWVEHMKQIEEVKTILIYVNDVSPFPTCGYATFQKDDNTFTWVREMDPLCTHVSLMCGSFILIHISCSRQRASIRWSRTEYMKV